MRKAMFSAVVLVAALILAAPAIQATFAPTSAFPSAAAPSGRAVATGAFPAAPPDGLTYFGFTYRAWDSSDPLEGDTRDFLTRYQDAIQSELAGKLPSLFGVPVIWQYSDGSMSPLYDALGSVIQFQAVHPDAIPVISWNAQTGWDAGGSGYSGITTKTIAAGAQDAYIHQYARDVRAYGQPLFIRPICGEANGAWWRNCSPRANSALTTGDFVTAWRRVVDIFTAEGATNVAWVWNMNTFPPPPSNWGIDTNIAAYYPGDGYVNWVGADHYDYGSPSSSTDNPLNVSAWMDPHYSFAVSHDKPFFLVEWGIRHSSSGLTAQQQQQWLASMFNYIDSHPRIKAQLYFNYQAAPFSSTAGHVFLYGNQVNYAPNTNDADHRLLAESGAAFRSTFSSYINGNRYVSIVSTVSPEPDTIPPSVSIDSPANGAKVGGTLTVTAAASDNVGVAGVQFWLNGAPFGAEDTTSPYAISWNTTTVADGPQTLMARARDAAGNTVDSTITVLVSNAVPPPAQSLVGAYGLDDGAGTTTVEATGANGVGTLVNGPVWTTGRFGQALDFDGVNDRVVVNNPLNLPTVDFTYSFWTRLDTVNDETFVMIPNTSGGNELYLVSESGRVGAYVDGARRARSNSGSVVAGSWTHIAVTRQGAAIRIYIDGVQNGSTGSYSGALDFGGCPLYVGVDIDSGCTGGLGNYLDGRLDELRIYNRALSQTEIQADMSAPIGSALDTQPPSRSNLQPTGAQPFGTSQVVLAVDTDEDATCRYGTGPGVSFGSLPGLFAGSGVSHTATVSGLSSGAGYGYYVKCEDTHGNANPDDVLISFTIAADTTPPSVAMTSPSNGGNVSGIVTVAATASDNDGVVGVQFRLNGAPLGAEVAAAPYAVSWDSTAVADGPQTLSASARDAAGNVAASAIAVQVNNAIPPPAPPPALGLVAAYGFDEGSGTTAAALSGLNAPGTLVNGPTWTSGRFGGAVDLDGINDRIVMNNPINLPTGDFTYSFWTRLDTTSDEAFLMIPNTAGGNELYLASESGRVGAYVGGSRRARSGYGSVTAGTWIHIAVTRQASTIRIYVNGTQSGFSGSYSGALNLGGCPLYVGVDIDSGCSGGLGNYLNGRMDELRIYNRAQSASEIQSDMNVAVAASIPAPVAFVQAQNPQGIDGSVSDSAGPALPAEAPRPWGAPRPARESRRRSSQRHP